MYIVLGIINVTMAGLFAISYASFPPVIPLFFSREWGEDQLGEWWMIILIPLCMNIFIMINSVIVRALFQNNYFARKVFTYANFAIMFGFLISFLRILYIVR